MFQIWFSFGSLLPKSLVLRQEDIDRDKRVLLYTQLVWAETSKLGCALSLKKNVPPNYLVCFYAPPGNVVGKTVYEAGEPATKCGRKGKSKVYEGLCNP